MRKASLLAVLTLALVAFLATPALALFGASEIDTEDQAVALHREVELGGYGLVKTDELKKWLDEKKPMLIIDTMPLEDSYKKNHIPTAVQFEFPIPPMESIDDATKAKFLELLGPDKERVLVFYCGFTKCTRSHNGALWAKKLGYTNVYRCPGGIKGWMQRDYPAAAGDK